MSQVGTCEKAIEQDAEVESSAFGGNAGVQAEIGMGIDPLEGKDVSENGEDGFNNLAPSRQ